MRDRAKAEKRLKSLTEAAAPAEPDKEQLEFSAKGMAVGEYFPGGDSDRDIRDQRSLALIYEQMRVATELLHGCSVSTF